MSSCSRGDIVLVNLDQAGVEKMNATLAKPALVVSSDILNKNLDSVLVCPILEANGVSESKTGATFVPQVISGLNKDCIVFAFQIRSVTRTRIIRRLGSLPESFMDEVKEGLLAALALE